MGVNGSVLPKAFSRHFKHENPSRIGWENTKIVISRVKNPKISIVLSFLECPCSLGVLDQKNHHRVSLYTQWNEKKMGGNFGCTLPLIRESLLVIKDNNAFKHYRKEKENDEAKSRNFGFLPGTTLHSSYVSKSYEQLIIDADELKISFCIHL